MDKDKRLIDKYRELNSHRTIRSFRLLGVVGNAEIEDRDSTIDDIGEIGDLNTKKLGTGFVLVVTIVTTYRCSENDVS